MTLRALGLAKSECAVGKNMGLATPKAMRWALAAVMGSRFAPDTVLGKDTIFDTGECNMEGITAPGHRQTAGVIARIFGNGFGGMECNGDQGSVISSLVCRRGYITS